jgi:hypothetical protein
MSSTHLYIIKAHDSNDFKFGVSSNPDARIKSYRTITPRGFERVHIFHHPRACHLERCIRELLSSRGALIAHQTTGRPSEMASLGEGEAHLTAALAVASIAGAALCTGSVQHVLHEEEEAVPELEPEGEGGLRRLMCPGAADYHQFQLMNEQRVIAGEKPLAVEEAFPAAAKPDAEAAAAAASLSPFDVATYCLTVIGPHKHTGKGRWYQQEEADGTDDSTDGTWTPIKDGDTHLLLRMATEVRARIAATAAIVSANPSLSRLVGKLGDRSFRKAVLADLADICSGSEEEVRQELEEEEEEEEEEEDASAVTKWLKRWIVVTGNKMDYALLKDVVKAYEEDAGVSRQAKVAPSEARRQAQAYLQDVATSFKAKDNVKTDRGEWKYVSYAAKGCKLIRSWSEEEEGDEVLSQWLKRRIVVTRNITDYLLLRDVVSAIEEDVTIPQRLKNTVDIKRLAKAYMYEVAVTYKEQDKIKLDGVWVCRRNIARGVALVEPDDCTDGSECSE